MLWCHRCHTVLTGEKNVTDVQNRLFPLLRCAMSHVLIVKHAETVTAAQRHITEGTIEGGFDIVSSRSLSAILDALAT